MKQFSAFPSIPFPAVLERYGFEDDSYGNDEWPKARLTLRNGSFLLVFVDDSGFATLCLIDSDDGYADPKQNHLLWEGTIAGIADAIDEALAEHDPNRFRR
jgi:hypothetical protein